MYPADTNGRIKCRSDSAFLAPSARKVSDRESDDQAEVLVFNDAFGIGRRYRHWQANADVF